jgi:DNA (cytosine-5)-methyltransferase 1
MTSLRTISLYSGAGGLDRGFQDADFEIVWANEIDKWACETYRRNLGEHIVCSDVLKTSPPAGLNVDVVIGGPPCQGFSVIGKMDRDDPRSKHVFHFMDVVAETSPAAFVLENVKALGKNPRWAPVRDSLIKRAEGLGFRVKLYLLNAADFGVPQARERMFLIGTRGVDPPALCPVTAGTPKTVRSALNALPAYGSPGNNSIVRARVRPAARPVMRPDPFRGSLLFNGSGRPLHLDRPAKTLPASMGGNATPIIDQQELESGAAPWVVGYHQRLKEGKRPLKRAPGRLRRITLEEAAALQSFPSGWEFEGPQGARLRQIGNAVPPKLAFHIASALRIALEGATKRSSDAQQLQAVACGD